MSVLNSCSVKANSTIVFNGSSFSVQLSSIFIQNDIRILIEGKLFIRQIILLVRDVIISPRIKESEYLNFLLAFFAENEFATHCFHKKLVATEDR